DDAGVLARALEHPRRLRGQRAEQRLRILVAAVLGPQRAEDAQLRIRGLPAQDLEDPGVLLRREAVLCDQLGGDGRVARPGLRRGRRLLPLAQGRPAGSLEWETRPASAAAERPASTCARMDSNTPAPSVEPSSASTARSGCGMRPSTLPATFTIPTIPCIEPFGFASSVTRPSASQYRKTTRRPASSRSSVSSSAT